MGPSNGRRRDRGWRLSAALVLAACYVDEPLEAPEPRPEDASREARPEPEPDGRPVSEIVEQVRHADAQARAEDPRWAELRAEADAMTSEERTVEAKQRFVDGMRAFESGDYETARDRFREAYVFAPDRHVLAYDIAKAAERAGDCCTAWEHYERFLAEEPDMPMAPDVEKRLEALPCGPCPAP